MMDVSRKKILVPGILCVILTMGSTACVSELAFNLKAHKRSLYLDMVYQVSTHDGYSEKALHSGYPWEGG